MTAHALSIEQSFTQDDHTAVCQCGWRERVPDPATAVRRFEGHLARVAEDEGEGAGG